jgi:hypothetical protein
MKWNGANLHVFMHVACDSQVHFPLKAVAKRGQRRLMVSECLATGRSGGFKPLRGLPISSVTEVVTGGTNGYPLSLILLSRRFEFHERKIQKYFVGLTAFCILFYFSERELLTGFHWSGPSMHLSYRVYRLGMGRAESFELNSFGLYKSGDVLLQRFVRNVKGNVDILADGQARCAIKCSGIRLEIGFFSRVRLGGSPL